MTDRVGEFIMVTQWHYKVRNRGRVDGYPAIDGEGREEGLDHKRTVGKTTLILQGIGVDAPCWKVIEQQDPLPYGRGDNNSTYIRKVEKYLYVTYLSLFVRKGEKK